MTITARVTKIFNLTVTPDGLAYFQGLAAADQAFLLNAVANRYISACELAARMDALAAA